MKLYAKTPAPVVYFLAGSLPAEAILHLKMMSLFNMICRLQDNPLNQLARLAIISLPSPSKSWFHQIKHICDLYQLPPPISLLDNPPNKLSIKLLVKKKITDHWERKLREDCTSLPSLAYFHPSFHSLSTPHPIWTSAGSSPYKIKKAVVKARMLSGRYRMECLRRHWSENTG